MGEDEADANGLAERGGDGVKGSARLRAVGVFGAERASARAMPDGEDRANSGRSSVRGTACLSV